LNFWQDIIPIIAQKSRSFQKKIMGIILIDRGKGNPGWRAAPGFIGSVKRSAHFVLFPVFRLRENFYYIQEQRPADKNMISH